MHELDAQVIVLTSKQKIQEADAREAEYPQSPESQIHSDQDLFQITRESLKQAGIAKKKENNNFARDAVIKQWDSTSIWPNYWSEVPSRSVSKFLDIWSLEG